MCKLKAVKNKRQVMFTRLTFYDSFKSYGQSVLLHFMRPLYTSSFTLLYISGGIALLKPHYKLYRDPNYSGSLGWRQ